MLLTDGAVALLQTPETDEYRRSRQRGLRLSDVRNSK